MIVLLGVILLVVAVVVVVAALLNNTGSGHTLTDSFTLFGHTVHGTTGSLFLFGAVVGAVAMLGLWLILSSAARTSRRGRLARAQLNDARREAELAREDRDQAIEERTAATQAQPTTTVVREDPDVVVLPKDEVDPGAATSASTDARVSADEARESSV